MKNITTQKAYMIILKSYPDVMSVKQMCRALSISTKTGYRLVRENRIGNIQIGRVYRIPKIKVIEYINGT